VAVFAVAILAALPKAEAVALTEKTNGIYLGMMGWGNPGGHPSNTNSIIQAKVAGHFFG